MNSFGQQLRVHRKECRDPLSGGMLTQERLGELLGEALGGTGYSGAAVSDWERDRSKIHADDRLVLVALLSTLHKYGGLGKPAQANLVLHAGNYRALDQAEHSQVFPEMAISQKHPTIFYQEADAPMASEDQPTPARSRQLVLLEKVEKFWIRGVLEQSVDQAMLLDISCQRCDELIDHPWKQVVGADVLSSGRKACDAGLPELFRDAGGSLLILGEPGSGKSTMLLTLARELIGTAKKTAGAPIPVVLNLLSWAEHEGPLGDWVVAELVSKYQIPSDIGRQWLDDDALLLLLDGYDEVPDRQRTRCGEAANRFREAHGLTNIVVCSRQEEYEASSVLLKLGGAIRLEPLSWPQILLYLSAAAPTSSKLRTAIEREPSLREAAQTPLMLNVMRLAYSNGQQPETGDSGPGREAAGERHSHTAIFDTYFERMLERRHPGVSYNASDARSWLSWLAKAMREHNQNVFYVENLQPSALPSRGWRWLYLVITRATTGLYGGLVMWLLLSLLRRVTPEIPLMTAELAASVLNLSTMWAEILSLIIGNLGLAMVTAIITGMHFERRLGKEDPERRQRRQSWQLVASAGLSAGILTALFLLPTGRIALAIGWGIAEAVYFMVVARYSDGRNYRNEVQTVEVLGWSPFSALKGVAFGLILALAAEGIQRLMFGEGAFLDKALIMSLAGLMLGGMRGSRLERKTRPNEGIYLSVKHAVIAALISAVSVGSLTWLLTDREPATLIALLLILFVVPIYGGNNVGKHILLRLILWRQGSMPLAYVRFLDYAAERVFLRKVGGGYIFVHRLLGEYFASGRANSG